jgi:hypothetical protein
VEANAFVHIYYQILDGVVQSRVLTKSGQSVARFPTRPPQAFFDAALLHPLKKPEEMELFYHQSIHFLRPIQPRIQPMSTLMSTSERGLYQLAFKDLQGSCVHNVAYQIQATKQHLPECKSPLPELRMALPLSFKVIHMADVRVQTPSGALAQLLKFESVEVDIQSFAENPPAHYLGIMRRLFEEAVSQKRQYLAIMTQDTLLHCDFAIKFRQLLHEVRCGGHLLTSRRGGVLLLGAREWTSGNWIHVVADIQRARGSGANAPEQMCYSAGASTFGTFAAIFSQSTFTDVLAWFDHTNHTKPFHEILQSLTDVGYIVRVAFPYLAIQDPDWSPVFEGQELEVQYGIYNAQTRLSAHKWTRDLFCHSVVQA